MIRITALVRVLPLLAILFAFLFSSWARAEQSEGGYYAAWFGPDPRTGPKEPVHVVVAGVGEKLKTLLVHAAYSQVKHWQDVEPQRPVLLLAYNELGRAKMDPLIKQWGLKTWAFREGELTPETIATEASFFPAIRSLDVYAHSARPGYAPLGDAASERFLKGERDPVEIGARFDSQAYAAFYGCNAGYDLAPWLAQLWHVPVLGALTSADLQYVHSTQQFYAYNEDTRPPGPWATVNALSFLAPQACVSGGCMRMKPDPHPYDGVHGTYPTGLGFYKWFCNSLEENDCTKRMTSALLGWLSVKPLRPESDKATWKAVLADFICPIHATRRLRADCFAKLPDIEAGRSLTYSPFLGRETACDFEACYEDDAPEALTTTSTFAREYRRYLKGLVLLGVK